MVAITVVTYNSAAFIGRCLEYVFEQDYAPLEVIVVDNASSDATPALLRQYRDRAHIIYNRENVGFAAGQNQAIALSRATWILTLNPDTRLTRDFVRKLVEAGKADEAAGSVCGKLLTTSADFELPAEPVFDSTGIYFTPNQRHFDRGSQQPDRGQFEQFEYVFGGTGAACLYRRAMIDDISIDGEFFDSDFFAYREDADVAWRAQLLGWKCLYTPLARAYHVRTVLPARRRSLSPIVNMHSVKNRWLLRIKNMTAPLYRKHWLAITWRDVIVIAGCVLREFSSLRAFVLLARAWPRAKQKRRTIMQRRRATDESIAAWFSKTPVAQPAAHPTRV